MGFLQTIGNWLGGRQQASGPSTSISPQPVGTSGPGIVPVVQPPSPQMLAGLLGPPINVRPTRDNIAATVWAQPYNGPLDFDPYAQETAEMRYNYRAQMRKVAVVRAAIMGKANDISVLEPIVLPAHKNNPLSQEAAEFVKWTIDQSPGGWSGLISSIYLPASVDGFSLCEKKLKEQRWKGRTMWGLAHIRNLDTAYLRIQMDIYRNVIAIVNLIRGLEYYEPEDVLLYSHNPMYSSPFGQSDMRAATRAADIIQDTYLVWYTALQIYGLPYMHGKVNQAINSANMAAALQALRAGGYCVTDKEDDINIVNLASAASTSGFREMVQTQREDIFFAVRGVAQPFMEGKGGTDAHTDTSIQQGTSDAGEKASALAVADVINKQLIPWLVRPNFKNPDGTDIDMPFCKLGGTDWKIVKDIGSIIKDAQSMGVKVSAKWTHEVMNMPPPDDATDELKPVQQGQSGPGGAGGMPGQSGPSPSNPEQSPLPSAPKPIKPEPPELAPKADAVPQAFSAGVDLDPKMVARVVEQLLAEELGAAA